MTHPALALLIGPEFDEFLCAPIGADRNGTGLSVLSALARLNVDPWQEATSLARMPREAAVVRLTALIDALPNEGTIGIPTTIAADLVALLPRDNSLNVRSSVRLFAPPGPRQTQILMALSALAIMTLSSWRSQPLFRLGLESARIPCRLARTTPQRLCRADKDRLGTARPARTNRRSNSCHFNRKS